MPGDDQAMTGAEQNPLLRLAKSSKALVVIAISAVTLTAFFLGRISWYDASEFLKWLLAPWLIAQGAEDAAKHFATRPPSSPSNVTQAVSVSPSSSSATTDATTGSGDR